MVFTSQQLGIVKFCAEEITRQRDTNLAVYDLVVAWNEAIEMRQNVEPVEPDDLLNGLQLAHIERLAFYAKPHLNAGGYRKFNVVIGDSHPPNWRDVPRLMTQLIKQRHLSPLEFYKEYEEIHPFADGNGRTGKIFYNWINGTLLTPQLPPVPKEWGWHGE